MSEYKGYITPCGAKVKITDGHPWAWEIDGEPNLDLPLKARASSTRDWHNGEVVIFATCSKRCTHEPIWKGPAYNHSDGDCFACYCKLLHTDEYDGSLKRDIDENHIQYRSWHFQRFLETGSMYCGCVSESEGGKPKIKYCTDNCNVFQPHGCESEICFVTKKKRDLTLVSIYADVKYTDDKGLLTEREVIKKGIKLAGCMAKETADRKIAEIWHEAEETSKSEYALKYDLDAYWNMHYRRLGTKPFRIYAARGSNKDLKQDLADAREGLEVIHDSDKLKASKQAKSDMRKLRKEARARDREKKAITKWKMILNDEEAFRAYAAECEMNEDSMKSVREIAKRELEKRGISTERHEQLTLL